MIDHIDLVFGWYVYSLKSTSICIFMLAGKILSLECHTLIATSIMEVEFIFYFKTIYIACH